MHLHGHHAVVLARDGVPATGSPWWVDSLNAEDGHTYDIAFVADNPGLWMDHCHNLAHPAEGLMAHLMYSGVTTPVPRRWGRPQRPGVRSPPDGGILAGNQRGPPGPPGGDRP